MEGVVEIEGTNAIYMAPHMNYDMRTVIEHKDGLKVP